MTLFLLLALFPFLQDQPPEMCALSGTAVNALTGEPLAKVRILAEGGSNDDGGTPSTTTDAKGRFQVINLSPGQYHLKAQRNGFLDTNYGARRAEGSGTPISLQPGQELKDLKLSMTPFGVIAGTVRDSDGEPLARITVTLHRLKFENGRRRVVQVGGTYTDDLGQFRIPDLAPGKYYVYADAKKAGQFGSNMETEIEEETSNHSPVGSPPPLTLLPTMYPGIQDLTPGARITGVDIVLARSTTVPVKGHVSTPAGTRVNGVILAIAGAEPGTPGLHLFTGVNDKGNFTFRAVPPGNYTLVATAGAPEKPFNGTIEMFTPELKGSTPLQVGTSPLEGVQVAVEPGAEVSGHVTIEEDEKTKLDGPVIGFDDGQSETAATFVDENGNFKWSLQPGHYGVVFNPGGDLVVRSVKVQNRDSLDEGFTVSGPGKIAIEIVAGHDGAQLEGVVLDTADKPVAGATVVLAPEARLRSRVELFEESESDQYGRFTIESITPGAYKLFAWEDIEPGIWGDPEFLKKYESQAESVTLAPKAKTQANVHLAHDQ